MKTAAPAMPRVLMVVENNGYPFDVRVRGEAETLTKAGSSVTVICPSTPGSPSYEVIAGVEVLRFPAPHEGRGLLGYVWEFGYGTAMMLLFALYAMARRRYDIVHGFNPPDTIFALGVLARLLGKKFVYDYRDPSPELYSSKFGGKQGRLYTLLVWMERQCCRLADLIIAPNEFCRQVVIERHGVPPERTAVVYNAPKLEKFPPQRPNSQLRARAATIIGYVGMMSTQDGIDYLLRALRHLKHDLGREDFHTVLVGPADDLPGLQGLADTLGVADHVQFTGRLPFGAELLSLLEAADICVEPAPSSPINNISTMTKLTEYMAMGKPIVAFDLPGNQFLAGEAALYARANDVSEFARQIAALIDAPERRRQMGGLGRVRVEAQLNWEISAIDLLEGYGRLRTPEEVWIKG